jgi:hypothetical protein
MQQTRLPPSVASSLVEAASVEADLGVDSACMSRELSLMNSRGEGPSAAANVQHSKVPKMGCLGVEQLDAVLHGDDLLREQLHTPLIIVPDGFQCAEGAELNPKLRIGTL